MVFLAPVRFWAFEYIIKRSRRLISLHKMAYSFRHTNPRLSGTIIGEFVCCGRRNCRRCQRGPAHGPYAYLYWRDYDHDGILRKEYIPRVMVESLRREIKSMKAEDMSEKRNLKTCREPFTSLVQTHDQ